MKKPSLLLSGILFLFFIAGCTSVKRYKSATWKGHDNSLVDMELFGTSLNPQGVQTEEGNLWNLSANAQTRLIQILDERYPDNQQFMKTLSYQYLSEVPSNPPDLTRKELRMVFSIHKKHDYPLINHASSRFSPADRIEYLKFSLRIPSAYNLRFKQWNRYTTEYGEIEIADVSISTNLNLDADGQVMQTDLGGKTSFSRNEQQELKSRFLKLNGSMSEYIITMEEEGTREIDLTGNVTADVSMEFEGFPERITIPRFLADSNETGSAAGIPVFEFSEVLVPRMEEAPDTIQAILTLEYVYRHAQSGWKTFAEWDDHVEYYSGIVEKKVPLFKKSDFLPSFYCIGNEQNGDELLKIRRGRGDEFLLQFRSYADASRTLEWLEELGRSASNDPVVIGNTTLVLQGNSMTSAQIAGASWQVMPVF